ncbi:MAG: rRNA maturation RNase YbeY [Clostridia bacterium]
MKVICEHFPDFWSKCLINQVFRSALKILGQDNSLLTIEVAFVSGEQIRQLNNVNRQIDKETDVLSFPFLNLFAGEKVDSIKFANEIDCKKINLGSIAICTDIAKRQAEELGHSYKRELSFLALHGLLHLLGFDHIKECDEEVMTLISEKILNKNKIFRRK